MGDNPAMGYPARIFPHRGRRPGRLLPAALAAGLLALGACGSIEWPPPGRAPHDINTPPPAPATPATFTGASATFTGASAVVAGRGDTVYGLSRRHRVPVRAIIEANGLTPPYHLKAGQRVTLPRGRQHVVRAGESLYAIARTYGANAHALARTNGVRPPYTIHSGQILVLPRAASAAPAGRAARKPAGAGPGPAPARTAGRPPPKTGFAPPHKTAPPPAAVPRPPPASGKGFIWPVKGRVISGFGAKAKGLRNDGINIAAKRGTPVKAAENGVVVYSGNELRGFGNLLLIKHANGWVTAYAHTDRMLVKRGDRVRKGQRVATVGSTGNVRNPQLHFELRRGRSAKDPRKYLRGA